MRIIGMVLLAGIMSTPVFAQDKPHIYVAPNAAWRTHKDGRAQVEREIENRTVEISDDFAKYCKDVNVNADLRKADYIVELSRRTQYAGIRVARSDIAVYRPNGDLVGGASKSSVGAAVKAACEVVQKDWPTAAHPDVKPTALPQ